MFKCKSEASALYALYLPSSGALDMRRAPTIDHVWLLTTLRPSKFIPDDPIFLHLLVRVPGETVDGVSVRRLHSPAPQELIEAPRHSLENCLE